MRPGVPRDNDEMIALYEQAAAALLTSAYLAEQETRRAERDGSTQRAGVERSRAERARFASEQAGGNARRARLRAHAADLFGRPLPWRELFEGHPASRVSPVQYLDVALIATDLDGTVKAWNRAAERLYGWTAAEVIGRPISSLTVGPDDAEVAERIMASIRSTGRWEGEFWVADQAGARFLAYVCDVTVADQNGRPLGIIGISIELAPKPVDAGSADATADATSGHRCPG
jgi:PAS domain S-box-containing protein